jgi:hypothetical protein
MLQTLLQRLGAGPPDGGPIDVGSVSLLDCALHGRAARSRQLMPAMCRAIEAEAELAQARLEYTRWVLWCVLIAGCTERRAVLLMLSQHLFHWSLSQSRHDSSCTTVFTSNRLFMIFTHKYIQWDKCEQ